MHEDFQAVKQAVSIETVANDLLKHDRGNMYFHPKERTASIKIYPETQTFTDFGRCMSGDCIKLYAYVKDVSQYVAMKELQQLYGVDSPDKADMAQIKRERAERERQRQRELLEVDQRRLECIAKIEELRRVRELLNNGLENHIFPPLSEDQATLVAELQQVEYELDETAEELGECIERKRRLTKQEMR